jgi:hypothetical protein
MVGTNGLNETTPMTVPIASNTLSVNIFTAPGKAMAGERPKSFGEALGFDPITSTLIFGEHDAVLVDAMTTVAEAEALADWVALHNHNLETIYITHGHFDHFYGLSYVGDTTPESRKNWIAALDRLAALNPSIVVAGHKKPGAPDSPSTIQDTKRYLQDFDRVKKTATSDPELFDKMTELYPHWVANQSWLMFGFPQP